MFPVLGDSEKIKNVAKENSKEIYQTIKSWAKRYKITLFSGSVPEYIKGEDKCYNTSYVFSSSGEELSKYRKVHLFELNDKDGKKIISEKDNYLPGRELSVLEIDGWRIALAICYDLRFPSFFEKLAAKEDIDAIVLPAAFTYKTGEAHWEILLRARAIEQQCFMLASNQYGHHNENMKSYGHSLIIDPWGEVLANSEHNLGLIEYEISKDKISEAKAKVPSRANRYFK